MLTASMARLLSSNQNSIKTCHSRDYLQVATQPFEPCIHNESRKTIHLQFSCATRAPMGPHLLQQPRRGAVIVRAQEEGSSNPSGSQESHQQGSTAAATQPALMDGVNWYCYTAMGLIFLTDFTPLGQWLLSSTGPAAAGRLALLQWGAFVVPTVIWAQQSGWKLQDTFKLAPASAKQCLIGLAAGPVLWALINTAIAIKTGNMHLLSGAVEASSSMAASSSSSSGMLLMGSGAAGLQRAPLLLLTAAVSPAVAEELLFRGLLLTALQERLGRIDAVAVCAALFALIHLDPSQFSLYCVLGGACGAVTLSSGSIVPAVLLHCGFNAAAVVAGLMLHS